jgi:hypothetical protein
VTHICPLWIAGGSISFEGWGAAAEATLNVMDKSAISTRNVTGMISMTYLSSDIIMLNPGDRAHCVALSASAAKLLATEGPEKFHAVYGSHFIKGYTKGPWSSPL